jgi:murein DD-endopeptidase MepM/ murein hydrolase activator NlpD
VDTFGAARGGGTRRHIGQDIMAPKLTPIVAVFDGTVHFNRTHDVKAGNMLTLKGANGWNAVYIHINNDTPGTDDGQGSWEYAYAPGLQDGQKVLAGQFIAYVGDSGNAEEAGSHLHFELNSAKGAVNAFPSLKAARKIEEPRYSLPAPDLLPEDGEIRLDGAVTLVDPARGVFTMLPVAWRNAKGKLTVQTVPDKKWFRLADGARLHRRDDEKQTVALADLQQGDAVTVIAKEDRATNPMLARRVAVAPIRNAGIAASRNPSVGQAAGSQ